MDEQRFAEACDKILSVERMRNGIGTLGEKTLHAVLKHYFQPDESCHEVKIGSFVADLVCEEGIVEIQTRSFERLRRKLAEFIENDVVTVVYPLPMTKWLLWIDEETGEVSKRRKSPKQGKLLDIVHELYKIKPFLHHERFRLCVVFVDLEEFRYLNGWSRDKKKGSSRCDRIPVAIKEEIRFHSIEDYRQILPPDLPSPFSSKDLKTAAKTNLRTAQVSLNILHDLCLIERVGKKGNLQLYNIALCHT